MATIFTDDFLLQNKYSKSLYHHYAKQMPIVDYHNHLPIQQIGDNKQFKNISEVWLYGDHYKWRAMRTLGINEKLITGNASDEEKFMAWASCVPNTLRNPLFHWTHLELKHYFGIDTYLNKNNALDIYFQTNKKLSEPDYTTQGLLKKANVKWLCTTDDPCDTLSFHQQLKNSQSETKVYPGFRPDKIFNISNKNIFLQYIQNLEHCSQIKIININTLLEALKNRIDFFHDNGCRISDHGLYTIPFIHKNKMKDMEAQFEKFLNDKSYTHFEYEEEYIAFVLLELCKIYNQKKWVQQFHLGALRNNNDRMYQQLGADTGWDSIGDVSHAKNLQTLLNILDSNNQLAKTIIYNLNPSDNEVFATMIGNFNDGSLKGKIQFGSAWWFLDQIEGMTKQINTLSNMGILSTFIGMLTDSRSFLSFPRHDYFRRLLCHILGTEMQDGLLPNDEKWIGKIVQDICFNNAQEYFDFNKI